MASVLVAEVMCGLVGRLNRLSVGVVCSTRDARMLFANQMIVDMVGPAPAGLPAVSWTQRFDLGDARGVPFRQYQEIPVIRALYDGDLRAVMTSRDGARHSQITGLAVPVTAPAGETIGSVGVFWRSEATPPRAPIFEAGRESQAVPLEQAPLLLSAVHLAERILAKDLPFDLPSRANELIRARFAEEWTLVTMAEELHVSPGHLTTMMARTTGQSVMRRLAEHRVAEAQRLLSRTSMSINEVGQAVGLADPVRFARTFRRCCGIAPSAWRRENRILGNCSGDSA